MKGTLYFDPSEEDYYIITDDERISITNQLNDLVGCRIELIIRKD